MKVWLRRFLLATALVGSLATLSGCRTDDELSDNSRPWNTPRNWETGLPAALTEGR
jgi:hypothetical protein